MKKFLLSILAIVASFSTFSQSQNYDYYCGTAHKMNEMHANALFQQGFIDDDLIRKQEALNPVNTPKGVIYKIPVVFHVLHNGGNENVSEAQIFNALDVINRDFRKQNADTSSVIALFKPIVGDVEMEFVMATKAPDGTCFRGFTRTQSALSYQGDNGYNQVNAVRNGNDVYQGNWRSDRYLNVYIIGDAGGAGGYTNTPNNFSFGDMSNGIWLLHTQFGEIGTSNTVTGRSLTHEIGHWFNLSHTWGSSNTPGLSSNCNIDDFVSDTPQCRGTSGGCPLTENACGPVSNVQNYMDYALSCQSMFTLGQVARMRTAAQSSVGGRSNLWTTTNLTLTGADGNIYLCTAQFSANKNSVCIGSQVQFTDESFNIVNGWTWAFPGADVTSSNLQHPTATYSTPGLYQVTLTATDGTNSDVEIKTDFIRVLPVSTSLPVVEGFESFTTLSSIPEWEVINGGGNGFELATNAGLGSLKSAKLANFAQPPGNVDELVSAPVDLTSVTGSMTLSFRHAYKRRGTANNDKLQIQITTDCGDTWITRKTIPSQQLSSDIYTNIFTPNDSSDWTTVHVTNILSTYWVDNLRYKFKFTAGGGNNLFIDNINLYTGAPSEELVVGLEDNVSINNFSVYPNPADNELNVSFSIDNAQETVITIQDVTGKITQTNLIKANSGQNLVFMDTSMLSSGMYFMKITTGSGQQTIQFVIK